jgi:hypothetical protein
MTLRTTALILGLASLAGGCTVTPRYDEARVYPDERRVIYEDDAYEGYYYVRIVYLGGVPWYVDEDLQARPVPPHLRGHFRYGTWARSAPPRFGRDDGVRDGYRLSRIVYIDGVPHHVDEGRHARPIPARLRSRFSYDSVARHDGSGRRPGERSAPPFARSGNEARSFPPATVRERQQAPAYGADNAPGRGMPPGYMREEPRQHPMVNARERQESPAWQGNALGRATERVREEARPLPSESGRERPQRPAYGAADEPRRGMPQARMREESVRQDPPFARNGRGMPPRQREEASLRGEGRDERRGQPSAWEGQRMTSPAIRQPAHEVVQRERAGLRSAPDERRAEAEPERKNGKGRGRNADEETDSLDERDGDARRRNRRDE